MMRPSPVTAARRSSPRNNQRGISMFVVIVIVLLSMLLALWGSRTALFNNIIVGNDADYQRAFEAAQALIQDAELDIRSERPDGTACVTSPATPAVCRPVGVEVWFPSEDKELDDLLAKLEAATGTQNCVDAMCLKRAGNQDFWNDPTTLAAMLPVGARYGQFTGAETGVAGSKGSNPILKSTSADQGGWYWIEVMQYDPSAGNSGLITNGSTSLALNLKPNVVYRISAIARGLRANTQVVIQSTYVRQRIKN